MNELKNPRIAGLLARSVPFLPFLDEIPLGVALLDMHRNIVLMNRGLQALTGFPRERAAGIPCSQVVRSDVCIQRCPVLDLKENGQSVCVEGDIINRDRKRLPVRITASLLLDRNGRPAGYLETVEDLSLLKTLQPSGRAGDEFGGFIGRSPEVQKIISIIPAIAQTDSSVLITGETGTGKDLAAEFIHRASGRAKGSFIKVNCGALPETLLESELFGHQKGAFTGAVENKPGRFRLAHNGTLYLTEIGDLPLALQVKLLTFLDDRVIHPLGSTKGFKVDVRIVAATHRDLEKMVREDSFRADLLFRLNVVRIHLAPLRQRGDDVRLLLDHYLHTLSARFMKKIRGFSPAALAALTAHGYSGNVRELRNIVEYAVNVCNGETIQPVHLPSYLTENVPSPVAPAENQAAPREETFGLSPSAMAHTKWSDLEKTMIVEALVKAKGKRSRAADLLGWGRSTLWRKMKQYDLDGAG